MNKQNPASGDLSATEALTSSTETPAKPAWTPPKPDGKMFMNRLDGFVFDLAVIVAVGIVLLVLCFRLLGPTVHVDKMLTPTQMFTYKHPERWPFLVGVGVFWVSAYGIIFHTLGNATWGQMRQKLLVVNQLGKPVGLAVAVARHWLSLLGLLVLGLIHLTAAFDPHGRTWFDKLTGCWVVRQKDADFSP